MLPSLDQILPSLQSFGVLAYWLIGLASLLEGFFFTGVIVPGTLIDLLDRAGQLPDLARALATAKGSGQKAADLAGLIDAFCALARRDDLKTGAETLSMNTSAGMEA